MQVAKWNHETQTPYDIRERNSVTASNGVPYRDMASLNRIGYYEYQPVQLAEGDGLDDAGWELVGNTIVQTGTVIDAETVAAEEQARYVAYIGELAQTAIPFATTLRAHFGDDPPAERNPQITEDYVTAHFAAKRAAGTITAADVADAMLLSTLFGKLRGPDGTTWSLPWDDIWSTQA